MTEAVIVSAARSPIGRANKGSLVGIRPDDLGEQIVRAALAGAPALDPHEVDDLVVGCGEPYDEQGANLARRIAVQAGLDDVPGTTITRFCSSSLQSTRMAFHAIRAGEGTAFVSAGIECVSRYLDARTAGVGPDDMQNPRFADAQRLSARRAAENTRWEDPRHVGGLPDVYISMGQTAENVAELHGVSRADQDAYALLSQHRAATAIERGFFENEITPVVLADGTVVDTDDCPRPLTTLDGLSGLGPVFREDGSVTAGNCCPLNDGAAALVIMSDARARELELTPLARIVATGLSALSPELMGMGPVEASRQALARAGMSIDDVDLVEMNEAFAAQVLPAAGELGIDMGRLNVHGGAIALGHPFGMTGARMTCTLLNGLRATDGAIGLETMCVGGGQGMAMIVERLS